MIRTWFGHSLELLLPAPQFDMYTIRSLTMQLDVEAPRQSIGGVMSRAQRRRAEESHRRARGEDSEEPIHASIPSEPSWYFSSTGGESFYQPSHSTQYYGGGSASRALSRDLGPSASTRYHPDYMADINSAMEGMNLGQYDQRLYQQVGDIYQRMEEMGQRLQTNTEMLQNLNEQVGVGFLNTQNFYNYYYQNP